MLKTNKISQIIINIAKSWKYGLMLAKRKFEKLRLNSKEIIFSF